jgi:hypothetical protein
LIPAQLVLAVMLLMAPPDLEGAGPLHRIGGLPMAWRIDREVDPASGDRSCAVISLGGNVSARLIKERRAKTASWSVRVGRDNQPGSLRYLRIERRYFQTDQPDFRGAEADAIVELLKSPGEFVFEWGQRPDYAKRTGLFGTGDFAARAAECERWINGTRV